MSFLKRISEQEIVSWWFKSLAEKNDKFQFGCVECLASSGRPWSMHNAENIESVCTQSRRLPT